MGFLLNIMSPSLRDKIIYIPLAIIGTVLGSYGVAIAALPGVGLPEWYVVATAVYAFISGGFGFNTASANTNVSSSSSP